MFPEDRYERQWLSNRDVISAWGVASLVVFSLLLVA